MDPLQLPDDVGLLVVVRVLALSDELGPRQADRLPHRLQLACLGRRARRRAHVDDHRQRRRRGLAPQLGRARGAASSASRSDHSTQDCTSQLTAAEPRAAIASWPSSRRRIAVLAASWTLRVATSTSLGRLRREAHEPDLAAGQPVDRVGGLQELGSRPSHDRRDVRLAVGHRLHEVGAAAPLQTLDVDRRDALAVSWPLAKIRCARKYSDGKK